MAGQPEPPAPCPGTALSASTRAAVLTGPRCFELTSRELPDLASGLVRVAVDGCGVCGSNLPVWEGRPWFDYPLAAGAPGHEAWGRVEAVGDGVTGCTVGDQVAFLCDDAFADAVQVPAADVVVLPPALYGTPFPGEALGCGFNIAARSQFRAGQVVCVVGVGFLGAVVTATAIRAGARVIGVSRRPFSLEVARRMGAEDVVAMNAAWQVVEDVARLTDGDLCDVVVEAVGAQGPLDVAAQLLKPRGRLVIAGFHQDGPRSVDMQLWNWRGIDVVNAHERDPAARVDGIRRAAAAVADGWFDPSSLYTHTYPLERAGAAMRALAERPDGFVKALIVP